MEQLPLFRTCKRCGESKSLDAYFKATKGRHGLRGKCKACFLVCQNEYRQKNRTAVLTNATRWRRARRAAQPDLRYGRLIAPGRKRCTECRKTKTLDAFFKGNGVAGVRSQCRKCLGIKTHRRARQAWQQRLENQRLWRKANPAKMRGYERSSKPRRRAHRKLAMGRGITQAECKRLLYESLGLCAYCRETPCELTFDHIEPIARGGEHEPENAAMACRRCNSSKSDTPLLVWLALKAGVATELPVQSPSFRLL